MSGSPQSTLCAVGTGCGCKQGSSRGSPTGPFQRKSSPPATWDLLYAAAGEVARMRMNEEVFGYNNPNRGLLGGPPKKPSPISVPSKNPPSHDLGFLSNHTISHQQQVQVTQVSFHVLLLCLLTVLQGFCFAEICYLFLLD